MPWWGWAGLIATVIGIAWAINTWILPRLRGKPIKLRRRISGIEDDLGRIIEYLGDLPLAAPEIRYPFLEAQTLETQNKYPEAIKHYETCFQPEANASRRAALHILIGNCYLQLSDLEKAERHYKEAEAAATQANDNEGLAAALGNTGLVYQIRGELDEAFELYEHVLKIERAIDRRWGEANALGNIGNIYLRQWELDKALDCHQQALKIDKQISYREGEAQDLGNIGNVYQTKGELDKALQHLEQALKIFEEIGAKIEIDKTNRNIQQIRESKGQEDVHKP
jgi:tetratricopeptide (TPR) repeat protein